MKAILLAAMMAAGATMTASPGAEVPQAPVPAQIPGGRRVFISYAGGENLSLPLMTVFSGKSDRVYNEFYAAMQKWGRYKLVSSPADADLVLQIGLEFNDIGGHVPEIGRLRLDIRDPHSNVLLWSLREYVKVAIFKGNRDKNLDRAMQVIVDGVRDLAGPATP
ncbi:MAG TPA: hypothetical protein VMJ34_10195 [Bryobacteraceae bacterium]|nr:hypothetical protein [Bryobacteraceae bacterium]